MSEGGGGSLYVLNVVYRHAGTRAGTFFLKYSERPSAKSEDVLSLLFYNLHETENVCLGKEQSDI